MTENDPGRAFRYDPDEPDLEEPDDGRDSQPPEEGSSDTPEALAEHDPLRRHDGVLTDSYDQSTLTGHQTEPTTEDDWLIEEESILDEDEFDDQLDEDLQ